MSKKVRINLRIDEGLIQWARDYAKRHGTSLTSLIIMVMDQIRTLDEKDRTAEAPQVGDPCPN